MKSLRKESRIVVSRVWKLEYSVREMLIYLFSARACRSGARLSLKSS